jgi:hypothetical protein
MKRQENQLLTGKTPRSVVEVTLLVAGVILTALLVAPRLLPEKRAPLVVAAASGGNFTSPIQVPPGFLDRAPYGNLICFSGGQRFFTGQVWEIEPGLYLSKDSGQLWRFPVAQCAFRYDPPPDVVSLGAPVSPSPTTVVTTPAPPTTVEPNARRERPHGPS